MLILWTINLPIYLMRFLLCYIVVGLVCNTVQGQDLTGQWKGEFVDKQSSVFTTTENTCEYVVDIQCHGSQISGTAYTYFYSMGKKYYTICKITGVVNRQEHTVLIREVARIKSNVPEDIDNYFQEHTLSYSPYSVKTLRGTWVSTKSRDGMTSYGSTTLHRRTLASLYPSLTKKEDIAKAEEPVKRHTQASKPVENNPETNASFANQGSSSQKVINMPSHSSLLESTTILYSFQQGNAVASTASLRQENIVQYISVKNRVVSLELYDNGEIDGDSVSLYFNKKLILCRQRLSDKPLHLTISMPEDTESATLVMFAENLGTIPPNTALMILYDGDKRHEVRVTSDLTRSGGILLTRK